MSAPTRTAVLIDGHALAYRSHFALPPLSNRHGESTQAVLGFMRQVTGLLRPENRVVVAFDPPTRTFRHEQYAEYKAGRAAMPSELKGQIERLRELVDALGVPRIELPGFEADDVIASLTRSARAAGLEVLILTSDRDAYQLLGPGVKVTNSDRLMDAAAVQEKYGVSVAQWIDYRALTGDPSDNIPGARGIGPKTAQRLLAEHGTLDAVLAAAQAGTLTPPGARKKIVDSLSDIAVSRELSQMVETLEIDLDWHAAPSVGDPERLDALLGELELASVARGLARLPQATHSASVPEADLSAPPARPWPDPGSGALPPGVLGYALHRGELNGVALLSEDETPTLYLSAHRDSEPPAGEGEAPAPESALAALQGQPLRAADAKALAVWGRRRGLALTPGDDPLLLAYLLDATTTSAGVMSERWLGTPWPGTVPERAVATARLLQTLPGELDEERRRLYEDVELPLTAVLTDMEARGVRLDSAYLQGLSQAMGQRLERLEAEIQTQAGEEFSVSSRDQLERVLYDVLGLASGKKTKLTGKRSTAVSALEPLRDEHPIVPLILEYRELSKLRGTYLDPLPRLADADGRLHTTFSQTSVATGRLSSLNPNLQNIPVRTEQGREIRRGFVASPGMALISVDYSQIELRLLAHISGDEGLIAAFLGGADIHRATAAAMLGVPEDQVGPDQRRAAKTVNFGVLYGMSAHRLSNDLGIAYARAADFIERYFATYPRVGEYIDRTLEFGREHGFVQTIFGRRRPVPELTARNRVLREAGERLAYNMPIQGTAADIMKMAMVRLHPLLQARGAHMLLQVHDELLIEAPNADAEAVADLVRREMEGVVSLAVPLSTEAGIGENWLDAK